MAEKLWQNHEKNEGGLRYSGNLVIPVSKPVNDIS
jgi:hypothetical protein